MKHRNILFGLVGLLIAIAGGVFVLLSQGEQDLAVQEGIQKEAFVAGVAIQEEQKNEEQQIEEQTVTTQEIPPQPTPSPSAQVAPTPVSIAHPTLLPIDETIEPEEDIEEEQVSVVEPTPEPPPAPQPIGKININTANSGELQQLHGVGPVLASRIIDYRNNTSLYYTIEDIKNVKGIGEVTFNKIKNNIIVGNVSPAPQPLPSPPAPAPVPTPSPQPTPQPEGHTFYTSSHHASKYYYCDTDSGWENLSATYLESYSSEQAVLTKYPEKTLHQPCE